MDQFYTTMTDGFSSVPHPGGFLRLNPDGSVRGGSYIRKIIRCFLISSVDIDCNPIVHKQRDPMRLDAEQVPDNKEHPLLPNIGE